MGGLLEAHWGVLEASGAVWGPSWASESDLSSALGPFRSSGRPSEAALARFGALVGEKTVPEAYATNPGSAQPRPAAPGNPGVWALKRLQFWTSRGCMSLGALHFVPRARWRICERGPTALATPSLGSSGSFLGFPVPGITEFQGFLGVDRFLVAQCIVVHCIALRRMCTCFVLCFALHLLTLPCFALNCTPSHCLAFA